ncbi:MAG: TrmH family RNA methyltransferase [Candidatus Yanofskybacteria bacterium]|nr:TrmH family RNA methyltransferase [Candidatus Yanofskybacteria bacterium]
MNNDMSSAQVTPRLQVVAYNVRSILNVGALFRTADAVGAGRVWLTGFTPGPDIHPERIAKTALGSEAVVPWSRIDRLEDCIERLRREGIRIVALERTEGAVDYRAFQPVFPMALIVGNEVAGLPVASHNLFDEVVSIPMRGAKESLNVAIAFGIAAYEYTRKWDEKPTQE